MLINLQEAMSRPCIISTVFIEQKKGYDGSLNTECHIVNPHIHGDGKRISRKRCQ